MAIVTIRDYNCANAVCSVGAIRMLCVQSTQESLSDLDSLVTVQMREHAREFTIVDLRTVQGLEQVKPEGERRWLVNSRIDMRRFNEVYQGIGIQGEGDCACVSQYSSGFARPTNTGWRIVVTFF